MYPLLSYLFKKKNSLYFIKNLKKHYKHSSFLSLTEAANKFQSFLSIRETSGSYPGTENTPYQTYEASSTSERNALWEITRFTSQLIAASSPMTKYNFTFASY